jgi:serine/threonine protein kinase
MVERDFEHGVALLKAKDKRNQPQYVVRKILERNTDGVADKRPLEIQMLELLKDCARIVQPFTWLEAPPGNEFAIFEHYPHGDLEQWWNRSYSLDRPVPEEFIWRFFVQMAQALDSVHTSVATSQGKAGFMVHRDIKPQNILVVDNGTKFPSFKLCDFNVAIFITRNSKEEEVVGTFQWQPPENPQINTKAADIWSLGACVQFLATGKDPVLDTEPGRERRWQEIEVDPSLMEPYGGSKRKYCAATLPRRVIPISCSREEQLHRYGHCDLRTFAQYSRELHDWMSRCMDRQSERRPTTAVLLQDMCSVAQVKLSDEAWVDMEL